VSQIDDLIARVDAGRLRRDLFYLASDPLPFRKLNYTRPGATKSSRQEADDYITLQLQGAGYDVVPEEVRVRPFRCDTSKPKRHQYSPPLPDDPWCIATNLNARVRGRERPDEWVVVLAHKDSQSWVDSPGAYDNGAGTVAVLEIARALAAEPRARSLWILFCNEEHAPWTSVAAAEGARERGEDLVAVLNIDSVGGKDEEVIRSGRKTNRTAYFTPEGQRLAGLMEELNARLSLGLDQAAALREFANDDDGSFIKAGYAAAVANLGSFPYVDPNYHLESDRPEFVDIENVALATQLSLAAAATLLDDVTWRP
jgi:hypothetical protein